MKSATTLPMLLLLALLAFATAHAQVPGILNYQGRVTVGGTNLTTNAAQFKFALVDGSGGTVYWRNDGSTAAGEPATAVSVAVAQGLYSTLLGDTNLSNMAPIPPTVFTNDNVNLRVWFRNGANGFVQLSPDQRIGAAGYALRAATADTTSLTNVSGNLTVSGTLSAFQFIGGSNNSSTGNFSVVAGGTGNQATNIGAVVVGGQDNRSFGLSSFVGGGSTNIIDYDTTNSVIVGGFANAIRPGVINGFIGGGLGNLIDYDTANSVIAGGFANAIQSAVINGFIGGGGGNLIVSDPKLINPDVTSISDVTIAGGAFNRASGFGSTVAGGALNEAIGDDTFAAGVQAKATNMGSFVWGGTLGTDTVSTNTYSFTVRAPGGVRFITTRATDNLEIGGSVTNGVALAPGSGSWTSLSDLNAKENFEPVDAAAILAKVAALPVMTWNYKAQAADIRHIGPTAQDFRKAFGIGESDTGITTVDADGVAIAAIQGLAKELKARDEIIEELKSKLEALEERLNSMPPAL